VSLLELSASAAALVTAGAVVLWWRSLGLRDASIIDAWWGPGFGIVALVGLLCGGGASPRRVLIALLVAVWGIRLGVHIARRNRGRGEDPRYAAMRARHGERFGRISLATVFLLQAGILMIVSTPLLAAAVAPEPRTLGALDLLGAAVWLVGFLFEAIGDAQLERFRADPANRGRVLDRGLWRYSRHPNYFGDATLWWGIFLVAAATDAWWSAIGPLVMTVLLRRVSGVTLLEKGLRVSRPDYAEYVARTSPFLPLPPRSRS